MRYRDTPHGTAPAPALRWDRQWDTVVLKRLFPNAQPSPTTATNPKHAHRQRRMFVNEWIKVL
jgi:hypothetical protein